MRGRTHRLITCVVLGALLTAAPAPASADGYDAIETRLKTTGLSASLAREITRSIRRGAKRLIADQQRNGSWAGNPGETALAALALVHTGDEEARQAAQRARAWLQRDDRARRRMRTSTYETSIMAMLIHALAPDDRLLADLQSRLARGPTGFGYWGYLSAGESGMANLSTSQFACLGLWAAERAGLPRADAAWALHRDGLIRSQTVEGSWGYWSAERSIETPYPTGSCMGVADLALARERELPDDPSDAKRWYRDLWAQRNGEAALARHVRWMLVNDEVRAWSIGLAPFYTLYAVEKAAIFLDATQLGGLDWYERGAKLLISSQQDDGSFSQIPSDTDAVGGGLQYKVPRSAVSAAFSLLFLLRASEVYRPITPRGIPIPQREQPVTGRGAADPEVGPPDMLDAAGARPPLPLAYRILDQLESKARVIKMHEVPALNRLLEFVRRTFPRYVEDGKAIDTLHDAWVRRAEELLVPICEPGTGSDVTDEPWRLVLAAEALWAMRGATARGGALLKKSIHPRVFERHGQRRCGVAYYTALFRCLREIGVPKLAEWLISEHISPDAKQRVVTIPALVELAQIRVEDRDSKDGAKRVRRLTRVLLHKMRSLEKSQSFLDRGLQTDVLLAVLALSGETEAEGIGKAGGALAGRRDKLGRER